MARGSLGHFGRGKSWVRISDRSNGLKRFRPSKEWKIEDKVAFKDNGGKNGGPVAKGKLQSGLAKKGHQVRLCARKNCVLCCACVRE